MTSTSTLEPLRIRPFRALWMASIFSSMGGFLQMVAASWLMLELTGSPLWVGLMAASPTLPLLVLALPAGAMADLIDRRKVLVASYSLMGLAATGMAVLSFLGMITPVGLLGLGLLLGIGLAINLPAWQAIVPDLVPRQLVAGAVALNSASFNVARAVGPALGGAIVAGAGPGVAFLLNALSYLGVIAAVSSFRGDGWKGDKESSLTNAIALGVRYARFTPQVRWLLFLTSLFALTSAVVQAMLPNLTQEALGGGALAYGLLLGAMGVGALLGAFTMERGRRLLTAHMVPAGVTAFGLAGIVVGLSRLPILTTAGMVAAGVAWVWTLSTLNATIQLLSPAWVRGRVMSLYTLAFVGFLPLGSLLSGALGHTVGVPQTFVILSTAGLVLGLLAFRMPVPVLGEVVVPEEPIDWEAPTHEEHVLGSPVMVANIFIIDPGDFSDFLQVMNELRLIRLRTGAYRWRLYREANDPRRMTEVFLLRSWEDHVRQHHRMDAQDVEAVRRARRFDRADGPLSRHLVAVDVVEARRPEWEDLMARHADLHQADGSFPLERGSASRSDRVS
jgi:MFS family permease